MGGGADVAVDERYVTLGGGVPSNVTKRYKVKVKGWGVSSFPEKSVT